MDQDFLADFNISDTPVFARKSSPPPPPPQEANKEGDAGFSTPSSSLLDTSNENSSAAANSFLPTPPPRPGNGDELMDHDGLQENSKQQHQLPDTPVRKPRNRSRAKRTDTKKKESAPPDVDALLAELEKQTPPIPPTLPPTTLPPPPPPPPPPSPPQSNVETSQGVRSQGKGNGDADTYPIPKNDSKKGKGKKKKGVSDTDRQEAEHRQPPSKGESEPDQGSSTSSQDSRSSQRTSGRIPRLPKSNQEASHINDNSNNNNNNNNNNNDNINTENHQGDNVTDGTNSVAGIRGEKEKAKPTNPTSIPREVRNQSAYHVKPNDHGNFCLDISSYRFIPDDDARIAILLRRMRGDQPGRSDIAIKDKKVMHQFPPISSSDVTGIPLLEAPGASFLHEANDKFITISDFASEEINSPTVYHTVARRDALVFIIVTRPEGAKGKFSWDIPTLPMCQDYSNDFISKIYEGNNLQWASSYMRSGRWGRVGTIILSTRNMEALSEFRRQFALHSYRGSSFDTHPKDALTAKADVAILLRASMKTFRTEKIPTVLFARNQSVIAGTLQVLSTTFHTPDELSHKGESKEHWRTVDLKGDDQFMRCLRFVPENQPFLLGYDAVQIRGGLRPQEENFAIASGSKRSWADIQPAAVPLLQDPRNIHPSGPNENSARGSGKRGRGGRGARRGGRGPRGRGISRL